MLGGQVGGVCVDVEEGYKHSDGSVSDHRQGKGDTDNVMYGSENQLDINLCMNTTKHNVTISTKCTKLAFSKKIQYDNILKYLLFQFQRFRLEDLGNNGNHLILSQVTPEDAGVSESAV